MHQPKTFISIFVVAAAFLFGGLFVSAQAPSDVPVVETSYEATLYVLLGSDDPAARGADLPRAIAPVSKQIRDNFTFANYRLMNTYYGRLANNGSLEYKSLASLPGAERDVDSPSLLDWELGRVRSGKAQSGRSILRLESFRFGARVPIKVSMETRPGGGAETAINYETLGLKLVQISLPENEPTLLGTVSLPKTTGTVFLVMAIRPV